MEKIWLPHYPKGVSPEIDIHRYASVVDMVEESFGKYSHLPAYACMGKVLTYAEIDARSKALTAWLQGRGLVPGDKVALMMPNLLQYPIVLFAVLRGGFVLVNTNPLYTEREMKHQFTDSGAKAIIIAENFAASLSNILAETGIKTVVVTGVGDQLGTIKGAIVNWVVRKRKKMVPAYHIEGAVWFNQALKEGAKLPYQRVHTTTNDTIAIQYTGGTTGIAKGAELTNGNLVANMLQVRAWMSDNITEGSECMLTPLPMYHIFSFTVNCLCITLIGGMSVLVVNPRDQKALCKDIRSHKITLMTGVNTLFNALNNNPDFVRQDFSKWKMVVAGAMALQKPVAERWLQITGTPICEGYGMTESSPVISCNPFDGSGKVGTIGMPMPSTEVRIVDEYNNEVPLGERGEIQCKGPQVMKGYYNRPEETANSITPDGWLRTGDIGIFDSDGYIKIVDRLKDMILVSGFNVYPNEIEDVIATHPKVLEVAAIGVPDGHSGEAVKVFIVKKDPSLTVEEIKAFAVDNFTGYKRPRFIEFRDELPKTNVGKILRRALRDNNA